jgi:hypothetical protein
MGYFWQNYPIKFTIKSETWDELNRLEYITKIAIEDWTREVDVLAHVWEYQQTLPGEQASINNIFRWSDDFEEETGFNAETTLAVTIRYSEVPLINRVEIILNRGHVFLNNDEFLKIVMMHELGHTVGLDHSQVYDAVMYRSLKFENPTEQLIHSDDRDGINAVLQLSMDRQTEGYKIVSPLQNDSSEADGMSCATISLDGDGPNWPQGPPRASSFLSLFLGFLLAFFGKAFYGYRT